MGTAGKSWLQWSLLAHGCSRSSGATQIVELVDQLGSVTNEDLVRQFGVSLMTVWRDLSGLEEAGRLRRVRGGATRLDRRLETEPLYVSKQVINQANKDCIARYAAQHFIADGDIVLMEAGTTVAAMARHLPAYKHLTVVGNGLGTMNELAKQLPGVTVFCCGGLLREVGLTFVGPQAEAYFRQINAHTCFLSATGITTSEGVTDPNLLEIQVKRAMARKCVAHRPSHGQHQVRHALAGQDLRRARSRSVGDRHRRPTRHTRRDPCPGRRRPHRRHRLARHAFMRAGRHALVRLLVHAYVHVLLRFSTPTPQKTQSPSRFPGRNWACASSRSARAGYRPPAQTP